MFSFLLLSRGNFLDPVSDPAAVQPIPSVESCAFDTSEQVMQ
jgi:hypothetical protein